MKIVIIIFFLLVFNEKLIAQTPTLYRNKDAINFAMLKKNVIQTDSSTIEINGTPNWTKGIDINNQTFMYEDLHEISLSFAEIKQQKFVPFIKKTSKEMIGSPLASMIIWLKFTIHNTHESQDSHLLLDLGRQGIIELFNEKEVVQQTGNYIFLYNNIESNPIQLLINAKQTTTFYIKITNRVRFSEAIVPELHTNVSLQLKFLANNYQDRWLFFGLSVITGGFLMMTLFALSGYYFSKEIVFFYYGMICLLSFFLMPFAISFRLGLGIHVRLNSTNQMFGYGINFFYILFIASLIDLPAQSPITWNFLKILLWILVFQAGLGIYEHLYGLLFTPHWVYLIQDFVSLIIGIILFVALWRSKNPIRKYLLAGLSSLWIIFYVSLFIDEILGISHKLPISLAIFTSYLPFFFGLGALLENFFFLMALSYRTQLREKEKSEMQMNYTIKLEQKLSERTQEIQEQNEELASQKIQRLALDFEHKIAETEMTALRSQMNPHFIFNCLNSIKLYTLNNDAEMASEFLTKFSRLIRTVLDNSRSEKVLLTNELETLRLYIELEAMRFKNKVKYEINIDEEIDQQYIQIPPLLIQPYVENAIWHGLMQKKTGGKIQIDITQPQEYLLHIEISDDGIGRALAAEFKSKSATKQKSFGLKMTSERINIINQLYNTNTVVEIIDLHDENNHATGTKVLIDIPI